MLRDFIFLIVFLFLVVGWIISWAVYHIAGGLIHLLLIFAVISLIMHLFSGRRSA
jgi:hypothetical protein